MPTYEFICKKCNVVIEIVRSIKDDSDVLCETCKEKMWQQVTMSDYVLYKGEGWARKKELGP
jgi:putative FmdB family regulatory protein